MDIKATKSELKYLSDFQKSIHEGSDGENFYSRFHKVYIKTTWYCSDLRPLQNFVDGEDIIYKPDNNYHYLLYTYLRFTLPMIKVKEEYKSIVQIAWCHNIGSNIVKFASFKEDDLAYQSLDPVWYDFYFQFFMNNGTGKRKNHKIGIGSIPLLEDWNTKLPSYPINVEQPWFYSDSPCNAYPLFYRNSQSRAEHRYTFRRKVSDLLRIRIWKNEEWSTVITEDHLHCIDFGKSTLIEKPTLWGGYACITDKELAAYRNNMPKKEIYVRDVEICDAENPCKYGQKSEISLDCTNPCLAMFWCAENQEAVKYKNYSNYTCNSEDLYEGWDPIQHNTLKYGNNNKFNMLESDHFNIAISRKHFSSSPSECGYHAYTFAWNAKKCEVGVTFYGLKAKLICKIAANQDTDELEPEFITRVRLLILKRLTIKKDKDDFEFILE